MSENQNKNENLKGWFFIAFILVLVVVLWFSYPHWSYFYKDSFYNTEYSEMGVFGDSFGALNTLFSAFAFTGIIASIYFQREELKATREELKATRSEMKNQSDQFEAQTKALNLQVFENTFFNMLKLHNDIVESVSMRGQGGVEIKGRQVFFKMCDNFYNFRNSTAEVPDCIPAYEDFYINNEVVLGHYFRVMYQLVSLVDLSVLSDEQKRNYIKILRAQLSTYELVLLSLNCLSKYGIEKNKPLIERYNILEHISIESLRRTLGDRYVGEIISGYAESAYGNPREDILNYFAPF